MSKGLTSSNSKASQLQDIIVSELNHLLTVKKGRKQEWLSRASGLSKATISKMLAGKTKATPKVLKELCLFLLSDTNRSFLSKQNKMTLQTWLATEEQEVALEMTEDLRRKIERYLLENDDTSLHVFLLCTHKSGVSAKELYNLGQVFIDRLNELLAKGWVSLNNGRYYANFSDFYYKSHQLTRRLAQLVARQMRPESFNKKLEAGPNTFGMVIDESLSLEAIDEIIQDLVNVTNKIEKFINDPKKIGPHHMVFLGMVEKLA